MFKSAFCLARSACSRIGASRRHLLLENLACRQFVGDPDRSKGSHPKNNRQRGYSSEVRCRFSGRRGGRSNPIPEFWNYEFIQTALGHQGKPEPSHGPLRREISGPY